MKKTIFLIILITISFAALEASAQPFDFCKFENKEGAQCPANKYAGNQNPYPDNNCSGTKNGDQICCCTKSPNNKTTTQTVSVTEQSKPLLPDLSVSVPGLGKFSETKCKDGLCETPWIAEYIEALYNYSIIIVGLLAVIVMMIGGVIWLTAGGNQERIGQGKGFIKGGVLGLTIAICSYLILYIINPKLTILSPINVQYTNKEDLPEFDLSKSAEELGISQTELNQLRGANPFQEGCGNIEKCKQFGDTKPAGLVKVDSKYGNVYLKAEVYESFKKAQNCVNPNQVMFTITDGWRSAAAQIDVKKRKPNLAARPCCSNHGSGSAMDLARGSGGQMSWDYNNSSGLTKCMNQFGLKAELKSKPNEPWHWSPSGK